MASETWAENAKSVYAGRYPLRSLLFFDLFLVAVIILATRLATLFHEILGHAFTAFLFGEHVNAVRLSLFGGGRVYYHLNIPPDTLPRFFVAFGGIIMNVLSGILALIILNRVRHGSGWAPFILFFGMVSLMGAVGYTTLGFYYEVGDPVSWIAGHSPAVGGLWFPFLLASPFISYAVIKRYAEILGRYFPARHFRDRLVSVVMTLGISLCVYAGLYEVTNQHATALDSPALAARHAEERIIAMKRDTLFQKLRSTHPEMAIERIKEWVAQTPIAVRPHEVPKKFPLKPVIALLFALGALMAIGRAKKYVDSAPLSLSHETLFWAVFLAAAVIGAIALMDG
ncbi:MAG: M50 family metallopeptidase, partial [Deltaproteobacteria bacterium]|nr:M50 family metallopeptidase [Deltaproteobacteria bacterium]